MANTYKILGQAAPNNKNVDLYAPAVDTSAVLSSIVVANTGTEDRKFSIYAQQTVPLGSIWQSLNSNQLISGFDKKHIVDTGSAIWAFSNYSYDNSFIHKSVDGGNTWTQQNFSEEIKDVYSQVESVKFKNGKFVLYWSNGQFSTSADAITWTNNQDHPFTSGNSLSTIIPTATKTLLISTGREVLESTDGTTWTEVTSNLSTLFTDNFPNISSRHSVDDTVTIGSDVFVVFTADNDNDNDGETQRAVFKTSDNGVTWVDLDIASVYTDPVYNGQVPPLKDIYSLNGKLLVVDSGFYDMMSNTSVPGKIVESSNLGQAWTLRSTPITSPVYDIEYKGSLYYVLSHDGMSARLHTSTDLQTFTQATTDYLSVQTSGLRLAIINTGKILIWSTSGGQTTSTIAPANTGRAIFNKVDILAESSVVLSLGISLGYGDKLSAGESESNQHSDITYTVFGSEITE